MARTEARLSKEEAARAPTRRMTVIAQDPAVRRDNKIVMSTIDVPAEDLRVGPMGTACRSRTTTRRVESFTAPQSAGIDREGTGGLADGDPSIQRDFRFHAQNAYALVMKTLAASSLPWADGSRGPSRPIS